MSRTHTEDLTGIQERGDKVRVVVSIDNKLRCHKWVLRTSISNDELRAWRTRELGMAERAPVAGSFAADVVEYFRRVRAMPTLPQRRAHLALWVSAFGGDRRSVSITKGEIATAMQDMLLTPSRPDYAAGGRGRPSAASGLNLETVRKRRTALMSFFTVMYPDQVNPVKGATLPAPPEPEARAIDYASIERALALMPTERWTNPHTERVRVTHPCPAPAAGPRSARGGSGAICGKLVTGRLHCGQRCAERAYYWRKRQGIAATGARHAEPKPPPGPRTGAVRTPNLAPVWARVLAFVGIPPGMLKQVRREHLTLTGPHPTVRVLARKKGSGVAPRTLYLTPHGVAAFIAFDQANAYGDHFKGANVNASFQRAAAKAGLPLGTVTLYDLRHSFLTQLYRAVKDPSVVARYGLHKPGSKVTQRYVQAANDEVDRAAAAAFSASLAPPPAAVPTPKPRIPYQRALPKAAKSKPVSTLTAAR